MAKEGEIVDDGGTRPKERPLVKVVAEKRDGSNDPIFAPKPPVSVPKTEPAGE